MYSAETTPHRELEQRKLFLLLSLQGSRIYLVLDKKCRDPQVLLHPKGSAAKGCFTPGEAKHFFLYLLHVLGNNRKSITAQTSGVLL